MTRVILVGGVAVVAIVSTACQGTASRRQTVTLRSTPSHRVFRITSFSMEPTLHCTGDQLCGGAKGDLIEVVPVAPKDVERGDIVAYRAPAKAGVRCGVGRNGILIHRVIGLPGETWSESAGQVSINGKRLDEPYLKHDFRDAGSNAAVSDGTGFFVMGDNRNYACDSRVWGSLPAANVIGRVERVVRPGAGR